MHKLKFDSEKPYLFISYSSKNVEIIKSNVEYLQKKYSINIWYDEDLTAGEEWDEEALPILRDENCTSILFFASEDALMSKNVKNELEVAKCHNKKIIPINFSKQSFNEVLTKDLTRKYNKTNKEGVTNAYNLIKEHLNAKRIYIFLHETNYYNKLITAITRHSENKIQIIETDYNPEEEKKKEVVKEEAEKMKVESLEVISKPEDGLKIDEKQNNDSQSLEYIEIKPCEKESEITSVSNIIKYKLYGEEYTGNQSDFMYKVFESVVPKHLDKVEMLEKQLTSFSLTDYSLVGSSEKPSYFRGCSTFMAGGQKVCVGASYGIGDKMRQIEKMIKICGEDETILEVLGDIGIRSSKSKTEDLNERTKNDGGREKTNGDVNFVCFGKEYNGYIYSDFMAEVIKQLFLKHSDKIEKVIKALGNIVTNEKPEPISYFRSSKVIEVDGITYHIATSTGTPVKLNQITNIMNIMNVNPGKETLTINGQTLLEIIKSAKK
ncbi:MAG: toll/interleukin-1 receptor domain-containing protein [Clostridiaceae bacterium]|nr:toll/interleukin-1 receptor domain-containing protein [Clostridiaceae bacterium]